MKRPIALIAVAAVASGCGGSRTAAQTAEAHLASVANSICRYEKVQDELPFTLRVEANLNAATARFRALLRSEQNLPRVATLRSDIHESERLQAALFKRGVPLPQKRPYFKEADVLGVKMRADLKALGLTACIPPPRKPIGG